MTSDRSFCRQVAEEIESALHHGDVTSLSDEILRHLAGCPQCRGGLILLLQTIDPATEQRPAVNCESCRDDLPVYIDVELREPAAAARRYAQIWRHLLTCPACDEIYQAARELRLAVDAGELPPLSGLSET